MHLEVISKFDVQRKGNATKKASFRHHVINFVRPKCSFVSGWLHGRVRRPNEGEWPNWASCRSVSASS